MGRAWSALTGGAPQVELKIEDLWHAGAADGVACAGWRKYGGGPTHFTAAGSILQGMRVLMNSVAIHVRNSFREKNNW